MYNAMVKLTKSGKYAIFKYSPDSGKFIHLAYKRWFNTQEVAEVWLQKYNDKVKKARKSR